MAQTPTPHRFTLDTLGKLYARGYGVGGYCPDRKRQFAVDISALIAERGEDFPVTSLLPLPCSGCGGHHTTFSITVLPEPGGLLVS
jgi:hypothetical protein